MKEQATHIYTDKYTGETKQVVIRTEYKGGRMLLVEEIEADNTASLFPWRSVVSYWSLKEVK